ncbi:MAG: P-loop NTPase fold protein, partial [Pseudomonadota bacterium]
MPPNEYLTDRPISDPEADDFNHALIAQKLASAVLDKRNSGSNVFAVTGPWGSGKSGILNLFERQLRESSAPKDGVQDFFRP